LIRDLIYIPLLSFPEKIKIPQTYHRILLFYNYCYLKKKNLFQQKQTLQNIFSERLFSF